jgi:hypothetical protein
MQNLTQELISAVKGFAGARAVWGGEPAAGICDDGA